MCTTRCLRRLFCGSGNRKLNDVRERNPKPDNKGDNPFTLEVKEPAVEVVVPEESTDMTKALVVDVAEQLGELSSIAEVPFGTTLEQKKMLDEFYEETSQESTSRMKAEEAKERRERLQQGPRGEGGNVLPVRPWRS